MGTKAKHRKPRQSTPADPLIDPALLKIAELYQSGRLTPREMASPLTRTWPSVPPELEPFLKSPSLRELEQVLRKNPEFFWHPRMESQFWHLKDFVRVVDGFILSGFPHERADRALGALVQAWVQRFLGPDWKPKGRRGRKAISIVSKGLLLGDYRRLLNLFKRHQVRRARGESDEQWVERLCPIIRQVCTESVTSGVVLLSQGSKAKQVIPTPAYVKALLRAYPTLVPPEDKVREWAEEAVRDRVERAIPSRLAYSIAGHDWNLTVDQVRGRVHIARKHRRTTTR